jgi:hypothetical protein
MAIAGALTIGSSDAELYPRNVPVSAVAGGEMREEMQQVCGDKRPT